MRLDEQWLEAAPRSQVAHGELGVMVSLNDMASRPPRSLKDGEVIDLEGSEFVTSILRMCRTVGKRVSCLRKPPAPCSAGISSPIAEMARPSLRRISWGPPERRGAVSRQLHYADHRVHDKKTRGVFSEDARHHAWFIL